MRIEREFHCLTKMGSIDAADGSMGLFYEFKALAETW